MDKVEAIELLKPFRNSMVDQHGCPISDVVFAIDLAIEALKGDLHCPKCGTIVRDGRQYHDLVYRGEAEPIKGDAESATTTVNQKQITGKLENAENATSEGEKSTMSQPKSKLESEQMREYIPKNEVLDIIKSMPMDLVEEYVYELDGIWIDDEEEVDYCNNCPYISWGGDCISRQQAIEALTGWETEPLDEDIVRELNALPPVTHDKHTETHGVCSDYISRQQAIEAIEGVDWYHVNPKGELVSGSTSDEESWYKAEDVYKALESLPPVTPTEQQKHGRLIDADFLLKETFTVDEEEWTTPEIRAILENAPNITPIVSEDCISRQAAIEALGEEPDIAQDTDAEWAERDTWVRHIRAIESLPSVIPTERTEEWILDDGTPICSACHKEPCWSSEGYDFTDFCPNCGAKMKG